MRLDHLIPDLGGRPRGGPTSWATLKVRLKTVFLEDWKSSYPPPAYYPYGLSLTPHTFMGLPKFLASQVHQMRSGKSYLAAHRSSCWSEPVAPTCPRCSSEEETFQHAILSCPPQCLGQEPLPPGGNLARSGIPYMDFTAPSRGPCQVHQGYSYWLPRQYATTWDQLPDLGDHSPPLHLDSTHA